MRKDLQISDKFYWEYKKEKRLTDHGGQVVGCDLLIAWKQTVGFTSLLVKTTQIVEYDPNRKL